MYSPSSLPVQRVGDTIVIDGERALDQTFSWSDPDTGDQWIFMVSELLRDPECVALPLLSTPITKEDAIFILKNHGIENPRVIKAMKALDADPEEPVPLTYLLMPDDSHLLVDGNHRYIAAGALGWETIPARIVPESLWKRYTLDTAALDPELKALLFNDGSDEGNGK